jgi:hypothetical protein
MEREKKVINKYPVSYRSGTQRFTSRRDLFGLYNKNIKKVNPNKYITAWKSYQKGEVDGFK